MGFPRALVSIAIALSMVVFLILWSRSDSPRSFVESSSVFALDSPDLSQRWVVSADAVQEFVDGGATLLDARPSRQAALDRIEGATIVRWQDFSASDEPNRGKLIEDDRILTQKLRAIGISNDRPVIVIGDPVRGWGEEGRIVWMLRSLGHRQAVFVDGGAAALTQVGLRVAKPPTPEGDFTIEGRRMWSIDRQTLYRGLKRENWVILDTREPREYAGETPYGETRGGHVPGAIHLYYKTLLADGGTLFDRQTVLSLLRGKGVTPESMAIAYCTGGVRSAWMTAVLADLGLTVKNYPGSMWEWSADPHLPLEQ